MINLVSNDARRFDDYSPHVPWIILAPIELGMVSTKCWYMLAPRVIQIAG